MGEGALTIRWERLGGASSFTQVAALRAVGSQSEWVTTQAQQWLVLRLSLGAATSPPFLSTVPGCPGVAVGCPQTGEAENTKARTLLLRLCRSPPLEIFFPLLLSFPHLVGLCWWQINLPVSL